MNKDACPIENGGFSSQPVMLTSSGVFCLVSLGWLSRWKDRLVWRFGFGELLGCPDRGSWDGHRLVGPPTLENPNFQM